ncbi:retrovirus-related pol polyprotein from transposon TNT 1-94 [Tanacetum coccineum]
MCMSSKTDHLNFQVGCAPASLELIQEVRPLGHNKTTGQSITRLPRAHKTRRDSQFNTLSTFYSDCPYKALAAQLRSVTSDAYTLSDLRKHSTNSWNYHQRVHLALRTEAYIGDRSSGEHLRCQFYTTPEKKDLERIWKWRCLSLHNNCVVCTLSDETIVVSSGSESRPSSPLGLVTYILCDRLDFSFMEWNSMGLMMTINGNTQQHKVLVIYMREVEVTFGSDSVRARKHKYNQCDIGVLRWDSWDLGGGLSGGCMRVRGGWSNVLHFELIVWGSGILDEVSSVGCNHWGALWEGGLMVCGGGEERSGSLVNGHEGHKDKHLLRRGYWWIDREQSVDLVYNRQTMVIRRSVSVNSSVEIVWEVAMSEGGEGDVDSRDSAERITLRCGNTVCAVDIKYIQCVQVTVTALSGYVLGGAMVLGLHCHVVGVFSFLENLKKQDNSIHPKRTSKKDSWKPTGKVFTQIGYIWRPTGRTFTIVGNACPLTRITTTNEVPSRNPIVLDSESPKPVVKLVYSRKPKRNKTAESVSKTKVLQPMSANKKEPSKSWGSTNTNIPSTSLNECRLSKSSSEGVESLLTGSLGDNLYTLSLGNIMASSSNFVYCQRLRKPSPWFNGESKRSKKPHRPKSEDTNQDKTLPIAYDLCGPMRVRGVQWKESPTVDFMSPKSMLPIPEADASEHAVSTTRITHLKDNPVLLPDQFPHDSQTFMNKPYSCYYDSFLNIIEPKNSKEALTQDVGLKLCKRNTMKMNVWRLGRLVPPPDKAFCHLSKYPLTSPKGSVDPTLFHPVKEGNDLIQMSDEEKSIFLSTPANTPTPLQQPPDTPTFSSPPIPHRHLHYSPPCATPQGENFPTVHRQRLHAEDPSHYRGLVWHQLHYQTSPRHDLQYAIKACYFLGHPDTLSLRQAEKAQNAVTKDLTFNLKRNRQKSFGPFGKTDDSSFAQTALPMRIMLVVKIHAVVLLAVNNFLGDRHSIDEITRSDNGFGFNKIQLGMRSFTPDTLKQLADEVDE